MLKLPETRGRSRAPTGAGDETVGSGDEVAAAEAAGLCNVKFSVLLNPKP